MNAVCDSLSKELTFSLKDLPKQKRGWNNAETARLILSPKVNITPE
jgi:hypothetical protein